MGIINWRGAGAGLGAAMEQGGLEILRSTLDEQRQARIAELQAGHAERAQARGFSQDEKMVGVRSASNLAERQASIDQDTLPENIAKRGAAASGLIEATLPARVKEREQFGEVDTQTAIEKAKKLGPVEAQIKLDAEMASLAVKSTPEALKLLNAIARATQVLTPGQVAEGQIKQLELSRAKLMDTMQGEYSSAVEAGNTAKANGIVQSMTARFFDPAKLKDAPELRAAQVVMTSTDSTPEQKAQAGDFIMKALAATSAKIGAGATEPLGPPAAAIEALKKNPKLADSFRAKYKVDPAQYLPGKPAVTHQPAGIINAVPGMGPRAGSFAERLRNRGIGIPLEDDESVLNPN